MVKEVHLAAQYLATAAISFLDKKDDDSHTNLGFNKENKTIETWPLNTMGDKLSFNYRKFSLEFINNGIVKSSLEIDGKSHGEIVKWITDTTTGIVNKKQYNYALHYELPYEAVAENFTYSKPADDVLEQLLSNRIVVQNALEQVVSSLNLDTTIRIWPHHFDTGGFVLLNNSDGIGVGFGMAIPDTMVNDFYLYTSGYRGHDFVETKEFTPLTNGNWSNDQWKGAMLPISGIDIATATLFFKETIQNYQ